jgi:hypothetical protein
VRSAHRFRPESAFDSLTGMTGVILVRGAELRPGDYLSVMQGVNFRSRRALDLGIVALAAALIEVASWGVLRHRITSLLDVWNAGT